MEKLLAKATEAAAMFSVSRSTFYQWVKSGHAPKPVVIAGVSRWRVADLHNVGKKDDQSMDARK